MAFIECLEINSSFRDDSLILPKNGFCKLEFFNEDLEFCILTLVFEKDLKIFNENKQYQRIAHKIFKRDLKSFNVNEDTKSCIYEMQMGKVILKFDAHNFEVIKRLINSSFLAGDLSFEKRVKKSYRRRDDQIKRIKKQKKKIVYKKFFE